MCNSCAIKVKEQKKVIKNEKHNRLTYMMDGTKSGHIIVSCDCGNVIEVDKYQWRMGHSKSCGCLQKEFASSSFKQLTKEQKRENHPNMRWLSF